MDKHGIKTSARNYQDFNVSSRAKKRDHEKNYKTDTGGYLKRLKLIFRDGKRISMPYAYLPLITLEAIGNLIIKAGSFVVKIKGRGLDILEEALSQEIVSEIAESPTLVDDENSSVFIASIDIEGENEEDLI